MKQKLQILITIIILTAMVGGFSVGKSAGAIAIDPAEEGDTQALGNVMGTVSLSIFSAPSVDFTVNGAVSATIDVGESATISWTPHNTYDGNFCVAANNWSGNKASTPGQTYTESTGPMNTPGIYHYGLTCSGGKSFPPVTAQDAIIVPVGVEAATLTLNVGGVPDFDLDCSPYEITTAIGDAPIYALGFIAKHGFNSPVTFTTESVTGPSAADPSFGQLLGEAQTEGDVVLAEGYTFDADPGQWIITFNGTSGSISHSCEVVLNLVTPHDVDPPRNVAIDQGSCGTIKVTWDNPIFASSPEEPVTFNIYRRISLTDPWELDPNGTAIPHTDLNANPTYTHIDSDPVSLISSNYYAVTALIGEYSESEKVSASPASVVPDSCAPEISHSDKDLMSVQGKITKDFSNIAVACSGDSEVAALPNNAVYSVGDRVTFQINICNSGSLDITNAQVHDVMYNLTEPVFEGDTDDCTSSQNIDTVANTADFTIPIIQASDTGKGYCSITISATVATPLNPSTPIYRFQNVADVTADDGLSAYIYTPPYLYSIGGGVPKRTETAPH